MRNHSDPTRCTSPPISVLSARYAERNTLGISASAEGHHVAWSRLGNLRGEDSGRARMWGAEEVVQRRLDFCDRASLGRVAGGRGGGSSRSSSNSSAARPREVSHTYCSHHRPSVCLSAGPSPLTSMTEALPLRANFFDGTEDAEMHEMACFLSSAISPTHPLSSRQDHIDTSPSRLSQGRRRPPFLTHHDESPSDASGGSHLDLGAAVSHGRCFQTPLSPCPSTTAPPFEVLISMPSSPSSISVTARSRRHDGSARTPPTGRAAAAHPRTPPGALSGKRWTTSVRSSREGLPFTHSCPVTCRETPPRSFGMSWEPLRTVATADEDDGLWSLGEVRSFGASPVLRSSREPQVPPALAYSCSTPRDMGDGAGAEEGTPSWRLVCSTPLPKSPCGTCLEVEEVAMDSPNSSTSPTATPLRSSTHPDLPHDSTGHSDSTRLSPVEGSTTALLPVTELLSNSLHMCPEVASARTTPTLPVSSPLALAYAFTSLTGRRHHQEDHVVVQPSFSIPTDAGGSELSFGCFGVFDGHNGDAVSSRASMYYLEHLQLALQQHRRSALLQSSPDAQPTPTCAHHTLSAALVQSLLHLDKTIYDTLRRPHVEAGSTACVALCYLPSPTERHNPPPQCLLSMPNSEREASPDHARSETDDVAAEGRDFLKLSIANLGDSRAVVGSVRSGGLLFATTDHRIACYPKEEARLHQLGEEVVRFGRVHGSLEMTRGLGDYHLKTPPDTWWGPAQPTTPSVEPTGADLPHSHDDDGSVAPRIENVISNIADVYEWEVHDGDFLIVASDGLWDVMDSSEVVRHVAAELRDLDAADPTARGGMMMGVESPPARPKTACSNASNSSMDDSCNRGGARTAAPQDPATPSSLLVAALQQQPHRAMTEVAVDEVQPPRTPPVTPSPAPPLCVSACIYSTPHRAISTVGGIPTMLPQATAVMTYAPSETWGPTRVLDGDEDEDEEQLERTPRGQRLPTASPTSAADDTPRRNSLQAVSSKLASHVVQDLGGGDNVSIVLVRFTAVPHEM